MKLSVLLSLACLFGCLVPASLSADEVRFNRDIRPILSAKCFACHGFDAKERKADLRLDTEEGATANNDGVRAIVPGDLKASELWHRIISSDEDEVMPPPETHKTITKEERETIKRWIENGAEYEAHWAFVAPRQIAPPKIKGATTPIDAFLRQCLAEKGLNPSAPADRATLIRRATLDLTGLAPTPEEVDAFVADTSADAWPKLLDRLLARPTYGEHMARGWLDLARYADTHGMHLDNERSMWPYRDWVVRAYNDNLSFDKFTRWQLAGDLIDEPTQEQQIASGFNRCNVTTGEGGSIAAEWIFRYAVDRTSTSAEVWMGLTAGCAACHDHKFDPISTKEYYQLYAFFNSAADPAMDGNKLDTPPILRVTTPESEARVKQLEQQVAAAGEKLKESAAAYPYEDPASLDPPPAAQTNVTLWFDDGFPAGAQLQHGGGHPLKLITKDQGKVFSGERALTRKAGKVIAQDFWNKGASFTLPDNGVFFVYCFLNPDDPPESIMVQFHTGGWNQRVVWGAGEKIGFGSPNTNQKRSMGALPKTGEWVRLTFPASTMGLKAGQKVDGYAFTQFGGEVTWDHFGIESVSDPAGSPRWSWKVWQAQDEKLRVKDLDKTLRSLTKGTPPEKWNEEQRSKVYQHWLTTVYDGAGEVLGPLKTEQQRLIAERDKVSKDTPVTFVMADMKKPRDSYVMQRGEYDNRGEKVERNVPAFLPPLPARPADRDYNRLDLADWLVSPEHPLTARVAVNRLWQQFFGVGLVETSTDFGSQGSPPSHPELLDWLAVQFVADGWDTKRFIKRLLSSQAYQQSSRITPELLEADPANRLLARGPRFRLDAEVLRDQALQISGLLVPTMGGRGVRTYQPPNIWEPLAFGGSNTRYYKQDSGDALYRRSLYSFLKRTAPPPFMSNFDAPNREQSCAARGRSNTPMQALQLMNDIQHVEAARNFAQRILKDGGSETDARLTWAWRTATARAPSADELSVCRKVLATHRTRYDADLEAAKLLVSYGESKADDSIAVPELAAWTLVANLLFNLDEVVTKN